VSSQLNNKTLLELDSIVKVSYAISFKNLVDWTSWLDHLANLHTSASALFDRTI